MAWNDPGGRDDDPWSRGGAQGPPDLDEAFRKFQTKLAAMFGGGGGGGAGKWNFNLKTVLIGVLGLVVLYGHWGVYHFD